MAALEQLVTKVDAVTLEPLAVVETPTSPSSGLALSRFEFETGKANEGTKVLMVEWDGSVGAATTSNGQDEIQAKGGSKKSKPSDWDISWDGKTTVLNVRDADAGGTTCRVYFLLPPGAAVPPLITIARKNSGAGARVLRTKPMPAIFPAGLVGGGDESGRRGVLHTIWAKLRLAELEAEIATEAKENGESVGLEMAMQEKSWIVEHFGLKSTTGAPELPALRIPTSSAGPASPRSPIGGRLGEKLRGLKLATSPLELAAASTAARTAPPRMAPLLPPGPGQPYDSNGSVASLNAIVGTGLTPARAPGADEATEEELFALPMSPRSPEMKRSPFSLL